MARKKQIDLQGILAIVEILKPIWKIIVEKVIPAIRAVNQVKRAIKNSETGEQVRAGLKAIFKDDAKVDKALNIILKVLDETEAFSNCLTKPNGMEMITCMIQEASKFSKRDRRQLFKAMAKEVLNTLKQDPEEISDSDENLAIELAVALEKRGIDPATLKVG